MVGRLLHSLCTPLVLLALLLLLGCEVTTPETLIARAEQALAKRDYGAAAIDLKALLQNDADNARGRWLLAEVYLAVEDGASAEKELHRARQLGVNDDAVLPALARALYSQGKFDDLLALQVGATLAPASAAEVAAFKTLAHLAQGQLEQAESTLAEAVSQAPTSVRVRYAEARVLALKEDPDAAMEKVQEIIAVSPDYADAQSFRGDLLSAKREFAAADEAYSKAISLRQAAVKDRWKRGIVRVAQQKFDEAAKDAAALQEVAPNLYFGHYLQGLIDYLNRQYAEAQDSLTRAVELAPRDFGSVFLLASVEARLGDSMRGRQLAERAVAMIPNHIPARKLMAMWHLRDLDGAEAERMVRPIVQVRPNDLGAKNQLAAALMVQGRTEEASALFAELAAAQPESPKAQMRAGLSAISAGDVDEGMIALERAAEIAPEAQEVNAALVAGLLQQQSPTEALTAARQFVERNPGDPAGLNLLATAQLVTGDRSAANSTYQELLQRDPGNLGATRALATLALADKEHDKAKDYVDAGLAQSPDDLQLLLISARIAEAVSDYAAMDRALERAIRAHPNAAEPRVLRAERYLQENAAEKVLEVFISLLNTDHPGVLATRSAAYLQLNRMNDAKTDLEALARQMPNAIDVQWQLARVYAALGEKRKLTRTVDSLLDLAPDDPKAKLAKARLLLREGQTAAAARILNDRALPPDDPDVLATRLTLARDTNDSAAEISHATALLQVQPGARHVLGLSDAYRRAGNAQDAEGVLADWLVQHPADATVRLELANSLIRRGDMPAAIAELRRVLDLDPENPFALNNLAWNLRNESPSEALGFARRAYEVAPNSPAIIDTYATVLAANDDFDTALAILNKAIDSSAEALPLILSRAKIRQKTGQRDQALADVQTVLAGNPAESIRREAEVVMSQLAN